MGGVPASNRQGTSFGVNPSLRTSRIIPPPPRKGGMPSSRSPAPHSTPMPVGPSILWALKARKSTPERGHVGGEVGDRLGPVGHHDGAGPVGGLGDARSGLSVPSTLDMA